MRRASAHRARDPAQERNRLIDGIIDHAALVNHYCSAWSPLPWLVRDGLDIGVADYRTVVPVVGEDPYPERGLADPPGKVFLRPASGDYTDAQEIISEPGA